MLSFILKQYPVLLRSSLSGITKKKNSRRESSWNIPPLLSFNVLYPKFKTNVVFHIRMLWEKKLRKTGDILNVTKQFLTHEWGTHSKGLIVVNPYNWQVTVAVVTKIILLTINWSLQPYELHLVVIYRAI